MIKALYKRINEKDQVLVDKQAEINRLNAENNSLRFAAVENRRLITELCDVLELPFEEWIDQSDLIQRARDATK